MKVTKYVAYEFAPGLWAVRRIGDDGHDGILQGEAGARFRAECLNKLSE